jgi:hypothetical protein
MLSANLQSANMQLALNQSFCNARNTAVPFPHRDRDGGVQAMTHEHEPHGGVACDVACDVDPAPPMASVRGSVFIMTF